MSLRKVSFAPGEYYHIYNRGNSKQTIFHDKDDYSRFMKLLFLSNGTANFKVYFVGKDIYDFNRGQSLVNVGVYCLMPNHFHLLISQTDEGSVSKFMQKLSTGYSMYYNNKYKRTGTLFEGKFKSEHVRDDRYLKYLFSYIHLNPIKLIEPEWKENGVKNKHQAVEFLKQYPFSSYQEYLGNSRIQEKIINVKTFPHYFLNKSLLRKEIFDWLSYKHL